MKKVCLILFFSACIISGLKSYGATASKSVETDEEAPHMGAHPPAPLKPFSVSLGSSCVTGECESGGPSLLIHSAIQCLKHYQTQGRLEKLSCAAKLQASVPATGSDTLEVASEALTSEGASSAAASASASVVASSGVSGGGASGSNSEITLELAAHTISLALKDTTLNISECKDLPFIYFFRRVRGSFFDPKDLLVALSNSTMVAELSLRCAYLSSRDARAIITSVLSNPKVNKLDLSLNRIRAALAEDIGRNFPDFSMELTTKFEYSSVGALAMADPAPVLIAETFKLTRKVPSS